MTVKGLVERAGIVNISMSLKQPFLCLQLLFLTFVKYTCPIVAIIA